MSRGVDGTLVKALRAAHALSKKSGLDRAALNAQAPARAYDRKLCLLAFLAPDIQLAILEGRQPASLTLERLVHEQIPLAWADQRSQLGF